MEKSATMGNLSRKGDTKEPGPMQKLARPFSAFSAVAFSASICGFLRTHIASE
jgi:hypothetical protein